MSLRPADDCHFFILEDAGVLFCEGLQALHALNTSAALAWVALEEGKDEGALTLELAETFGIPQEEARGATGELLKQWGQRGLLAGTENRRPTLERPPGFDPGPLPAPPSTIDCYRESQYRMLDTSFTVVYGTAEQAERVHPVLAHLSSSVAAPHEVELAIVQTGEGYLILSEGEPQDFCGSLAALGPAVKASVLRRALDDHPYLFQIHAGVVAKQARCLLLPAIAGSGKTSLTAGLVHAGWHYLSDECAPLGVEQPRVRPVPLAMATKPGAWPVLSPYYPEIERLPVHLREDGQRVRYLPPPAERVAPDRSPGYKVRWIVFPAYSPGVESRLEPLPKMETMKRLLAECLSLPVRLERSHVQGLVDWMNTIDSYRLPNSNLDEAVRLVNRLAEHS